MQKRNLDLVVISDLHLGTIGCHADELNRYLDSINPGAIILNGDILDMWHFKKYYWPESHMTVIKKLMGFLSAGVPVYYLTGNHDEMLRKFSDLQLGSFQLRDKLLLNLNDEQAWIFHGDVFDITMRHSKWLARLGGIGYNSLILLNRFINFISEKGGRGKISFSKRIKESVKSAIKYIDNFEQTAIELAAEKGYHYVICGHIHQPVIKKCECKGKQVTYLNSGDWIENLTALEYNNGKWKLYRYFDDPIMQNSYSYIPESVSDGSLAIDMDENIAETIGL